VFYDVTLNSADPGLTQTDDVLFLGAYSPFSLTAEHQMALYMANDGKLHYPSSTVQVNAFRAYFQLTEETENVVLNFGNGWTESYSLTSGSSGQQATWTVVKIDNTAETEMVVTRNGGANETVACTTPFTTQTINPENLTKATLHVLITGYSVYLVNPGSNKLNVVKAVKELAGLTLREAKDLVDSADGTTPVLIKTFATAEEAQAAKQTLETAGATVQVNGGGTTTRIYRNGVNVTAQGTTDGGYLCFEVTADNLANTTWVITTEPVMPNPYDVNGDGVVDGKDARKIKDVYLNQ
jgi:ribosomal protein L7/L12